MLSAETVDPQLPAELAKTLQYLTPSGAPSARPRPSETARERYEERALLGAGGMGEVRLCKDQHIGREVAIKVIRAGRGATTDARMRFMREARVQGQLEHPSIVPVYDLGITDRGDAYFTMKRVRGMTLEAVIAGQRRGEAALLHKYSRRKLLTAFSNVCLSVDFAHSRSVLHRDLKPSNIMLGDFGEVYVLDWGIAKVVGTPDSERSGELVVAAESGPTAEGSVLGTPGYMAPEQLRGERLDERADVYALGAILFEILACEPLHAQDTVDDIVRSTIDGAEARVTVRAPLREIPPELDAICVRATALDREHRFGDARELSDAIERFLDGDRDLELRRAMAATHANAAERLAGRAFSEGDGSYEPRRAAMHEVGKALAFDPSHTGARETLVRLLTEAPRELPTEAAAERDATQASHERLGAAVGAIAYVGWLLGSILLVWMGIRDARAFAFFVGAQALAVTACVWRARAKRPGGLPFLAVRVGAWLATLSMFPLFGPLVVLPSVVVGTGVSMLLHPERRARALVVVFGCLTVAVPLALQSAGVLPASYAFEAGAIVLRPWMTHFPATLTLGVLAVYEVGTMIMSAVLVIRVRDELTEAERRLALNAWHLRQLVPDASRRDGLRRG